MKIELLQCDRGHFYTTAQGRCPLCFAESAPVIVPEELDLPEQPIPIPETRPEIFQAPIFEPDDISVTTPAYEEPGLAALSVDPVVGWLVCTAGPDRGASWRLHSGTNFIGRKRDMDVCIPGDEMITGDKACAVSYDERSRTFFIEDGNGRNNIYLNGKILRTSEDLVIYDRISIGSTELMLIPFCTEQFNWSDI